MIGGVQPDRRFEEHLHLRGGGWSLQSEKFESNLGCEHVSQPSGGSLQGDPSEEEDGEDEVGEESCEVDNLARACNSWNQN